MTAATTVICAQSWFGGRYWNQARLLLPRTASGFAEPGLPAILSVTHKANMIGLGRAGVALLPIAMVRVAP